MIMEGNKKKSNNLIINNKLGKNRKIKVIILLLILFMTSGVIGVINIGCAPLFGAKGAPEETVLVGKGDLGETISIIGKVVPENEMEVSLKSFGTVKSINVELEIKVKKGDIIATLKNEDLKSALENAETDLENVKQKVAQEIKIAQDAVNQADQASHNTWILKQKKSQLYDQQKPPAGSTGEERITDKYQDSVNKQSDEMTLEQAHDAYWNAVNNLNTLKINSASEIENIERVVSEAERELEDLTLTSPIDGTITQLDLKVGQEIEAQATTQATLPKITITDLSKFHIEADVDEIDIGKIKEGQKALIVLDTYPDEELIGNIYYISQMGDESTGAVTYEVRFDIKDNKGLKIRTGMSATIDIEIEGVNNVLILPNNAITEKDEKKFVIMVKGEEKKEVEIETGYSDGVNTEIVSGLKEGDKVIVQETK